MKYPIYIPTKGRFENNFTANLLLKNNIDFRLFVEDIEYQKYEERFGKDKLIMLDGHDFGGVGYARNFIKKYSTSKNEKKHWQLDDDIKEFFRLQNRKNLKCSPNEALTAVEEFTDQFKNIGITGIASNAYVCASRKPFEINRFAYTCFLLNNSIPYWFRNDLEEDLDMNLQILTGKLCTVKINIYNFCWNNTGKLKGGWTELNQNNKRKIRMLKTISEWPIIPCIVRNKNGKLRLKTELIWRQFKTNLIRND